MKQDCRAGWRDGGRPARMAARGRLAPFWETQASCRIAPTATGELTLKVSESSGKDVGRGLARIDPADMQRLGADIGDVVEIAGHKTTVCKLLPGLQGAPRQGTDSNRRHQPRKRRRRDWRIHRRSPHCRPAGRRSRSRPAGLRALQPRLGIYRQPAGRPAGGGRRPRAGHAVRQPLRRFPG